MADFRLFKVGAPDGTPELTSVLIKAVQQTKVEDGFLKRLENCQRARMVCDVCT